MKTYDECVLCFERQAADACGLCDMDPNKTAKVVDAVRDRTASFSRLRSPVEMAVDIHALVHAAAGNGDPYAAIKHASNSACRNSMAQLSGHMDSSSDRFETAVKLAIAGNLIDFGAYKPVSLSEGHILRAVEETLQQPLAGDSIESLRTLIDGAQSILFVGDNAGECFLDTFLLDQLPLDRVTYAVRGGPVLNDATMEDACAAGIQERCRLIDTGDGTPGVILDRCSAKFLTIFDKADLVIAKGQGNYESLSEVTGKTRVFLTKVKCPVIARDIGYSVGSSVIQITHAGPQG
jgi:damage-control phosphatase, subfamily I